MENKRKYSVHVCRTGYGHRTVEIEADSLDEAQEKALDEAGDHDYSEGDADYSVEGITQIAGEPEEIKPFKFNLQPLNMISVGANRLTPGLYATIHQRADFTDKSDSDESIIGIGTLEDITNDLEVHEEIRNDAQVLLNEVNEYCKGYTSRDMPAYIFIMK